jgi:hypothetical protein
MKISPEKYEELLYNRIKGMLCLAKSENNKNLVLGHGAADLSAMMPMLWQDCFQRCLGS